MRLTALAVPILVLAMMVPFRAAAGPPYRTDDPEPVEYRDWEVYLASQYANDRSGQSLTAPHVEINYGFAPNFQIHAIFPAECVKLSGIPARYGYGDTEVGLKWRFFEDEASKFMIGTFPLVEVPTGDRSRGLGNGDPQVFLPLWLQKSWGPWTSYGGGGYWVNSGEGHRDFWYIGWLVQREINKTFTLGGEIFHQAPSEIDGDSHTGFDLGAIINLTEHHHILLSAGRDLAGPTTLYYYAGYQLTFGPAKETGPAETH